MGYAYDSLGRLIGAYDPSGNAAVYNYDAVGNLLSIAARPYNQFAGVGLSSNSSAPGQTLTIYGTDFCSNPAVTFNGLTASVVSSTLTSITVTVPVGASSGAVVVTCGTNHITVGTFTSSSSAPSIASFTPIIGDAGTLVTINGGNFQTTSSNDLVQFGATNASVSSATTSAISTSVPSNSSTGHIMVTTPTGQAMSTGYFFVPPSGSTISSTNSIAIGGAAVTVSITTSPAQALLAFDGSAGQQISLNATNSTITGSNNLIYIIPPNGTTANAIASLNLSGASGAVSDITLPDDGTYVIYIDPASGDTGNVTIQLAGLTDLSGSVLSDSYKTAIMTDSPQMYWRLNESGPGMAVDAVPTIAYQVTGPTVPDAALALNGSNSYISTDKSLSSPSSFSVEVWFKTTSNNGGLLASFGSSQTGPSTSLARALYMDNGGNLHFGIYNGSTYPSASSSNAYNDGGWHHAVGTYDGSGNLILYVDGTQAGSASGAGTAQAYTGHWRFGYDQLASGWNPLPASSYLQGSLGEAAIYPSVLTSTQVSNHYAARSGGTYDSTIMADAPSFYWKLKEGADTEFADSSASGNNPGIAEGLINNNGTYEGSATYGYAGIVSDETSNKLDGATGEITTLLIQPQPAVFSIEAWFSTGGTTRGNIVSFSQNGVGASGKTYCQLYITELGYVEFAVSPDGSTYYSVKTTGTYNTGTFHYVVAKFDGANVLLKVDNVYIGSVAGTIGKNFGYWRLGSNDPSYFFSGRLNDIAIYQYALSSTQISNHYTASGR